MNIILNAVDFWYRPQEPIFTDLNLTIPLRSWVAITGESGCGKTTLVKLLAGLLQPCRGEIVYPFSDTLPVGFLYQNPEDQLVQLNVERELAFNLENQGLRVPEMRNQVNKVLRVWNLYERRLATSQELSGGEKQRLALASVLINNPRILILDEPTARLDIFTRLELYQIIPNLVANGISIVWVTQDEYEIALAEAVLEISNDGAITWR